MLETEIKKLTAAITTLTAVIQGPGGGAVLAGGDEAERTEVAVAITLDAVRERVTNYCALAEDQEQRNVLTASIKKLLGVFNAEKFGDVNSEHYPAMLEMVDHLTQAYKSGGTAGVESYVFSSSGSEETSVDDLM